jgi:hypothetical protein
LPSAGCSVTLAPTCTSWDEGIADANLLTGRTRLRHPRCSRAVRWGPTGDGREVDTGGYDGTVWLWELVSEDGTMRRSVRVKVSGTAMVTRDVHWRVAGARHGKGATEITRVLQWDEPPEEIEFHSGSRAPTYLGGDPGREARAVAEIVDWFEQRGIVVLFAGHGYGTGPQRPSIQRWAANLIDLEKDELLARFEGRTRLEAAQAAQASWRERREATPQTVKSGTATEIDTALPITPHGGVGEQRTIGPDQAVQIRKLQTRYALIVTAPDPNDPDSGYMIEVFDKVGQLVGIAVQPTLEDALLTIIEDLIPPAETA